MAYTISSLKIELEILNPKLALVHPGFHFQADARNFSNALDLYNGDLCETNLHLGSPRECVAAAYQYIVLHMKLPNTPAAAPQPFTFRPIEGTRKAGVVRECPPEDADFYGVYNCEDDWEFDCTDADSAECAVELLNS